MITTSTPVHSKIKYKDQIVILKYIYSYRKNKTDKPKLFAKIETNDKQYIEVPVEELDEIKE